MDVTFCYEDKVVTLQLSPSTPLHSLPPILTADFSIPPTHTLSLYHNGRTLDTSLTLDAADIHHRDVIEVTRTTAPPASSPSDTPSTTLLLSVPPELWSNPPSLHAHFHANPSLLPLLRAHDPELHAAMSQPSPAAVHALLYARYTARANAQRAQSSRMQTISSDPMSEEAQRLIEEEIRQANIAENMESAIEYSPESFGHIIMLYIPMIVNGHPLQAFVDSGAQSTIMSRACAERCGIMRLCDTRFAGMAKGIGSAKILGRVHSVKVQVGSVFFLASFTILDMGEGGGTDFLFGLDQLRKHRGIIDLSKNCLSILGQDIQFLAEKDLPPSARGGAQERKEDGVGGGSAASSSSSSFSSPSPSASSQSPMSSAATTRAVAGALPPPQSRPTPVASLQPTTMPSPGVIISPPQSLASSSSSSFSSSPPATARLPVNTPVPMSTSPPRPAAVSSSTSSPPSTSSSAPSEQKVRTLMELGFQRPEAERALQLHGGNEEQAASFLFNQHFGL